MTNSGPIEAALTTDLRSEPHNFSLWDVHTGSNIVLFKGIKSCSLPNSVHLINDNHFISASDNVLHIWSIFNRRCQDQKLFLPGQPNCLITSPCGQYLIVGITDMIYIWQLHSGNLLAHTHRHYQAISTLKMNRDGTILFSGGEDGMILVWPFADILCHTQNISGLISNRSNIGNDEPIYTWQHHSSSVTDLHITNGGRCISVSLDSTMNIYSYKNGNRLYTVSMPNPLTSVTMNKNENTIYVGTQKGDIHEILVSSLSLSMIIHRSENEDKLKQPILSGHTEKVTKLAISLDGTKLISASHDATCKVWDLHSKKLINDLKHKGPLANLQLLIVPDALAIVSMAGIQTKPPLSIRPLKRNVYKPPRESTICEEDLFEESSVTTICIQNRKNTWEKNADLPKTSDVRFVEQDIADNQLPNGSTSQNPNSEIVIQNLKRKVQELYEFSTEKIFKDAHASKCKELNRFKV